jgi:hypothetical protein
LLGTLLVLGGAVAGGCSLNGINAGNGPGVVDANPLDAGGADAGPVDGAGPAEANPGDGGEPVEADASPTSPWCTGDAGAGHQFCADFDEGNVALGWDGLTQAGSGTASLDLGRASSLPASFLSMVPPDLGGAIGAQALLHKAFGSITSRAVVRFDILTDVLPSSGTAERLALLSFSTTALALLVLEGQPITLSEDDLGDGGARVATFTASVGPKPVWATVQLELDVAGSTNGGDSVRLLIDGSVVLTAMLPEKPAGGASLFLGLNGLPGSKGATVHYDNVTVDVY